MTNSEKLQELFERLDEIEAYSRCLGKVQFDMECCAPEEGIEQAGADMSILGKYLYTLTHAERFEQLVTELHADSEGLTPVQKKAVEHLYEGYARVKNISAELNYEMDVVANKAYGDWLKAKKASDFSLFRDSLAALIDYNRKAIDLRDEKKASYYDTCLDDLEKGGSMEQLDALVLMTTEHPFTDNFGPHDVRVTTHYHEDSFISNVFTTLHEGGHALFMQNEPAELHENHGANNMSNAMHETISRFYENLVGRSEEFIAYVAPKIRELAGGTFDDISDRELYEAVNVARPSLIRTEADELSYCLHIMVRYELEKAFMNGEITVDEIPALWNAKYQEYLGIEVPDDARGCLQDVHWCGYAFGYFPSYALGNAYGVQILRRMQQDFDVYAAIREGKLTLIRDWLIEHVFSIASLSTPDEWIRAITGESLNVNYYLDYLEEKFSRIYEL